MSHYCHSLGILPNSPVALYREELAQGNLGAAMVSIIKGTGASSLLAAFPHFLFEPLMTLAIRAEARSARDDDVPLQVLIPTMLSDAQVMKDMEGPLERFQALQAKALLPPSSKNPAYLRDALDGLSKVLPHAQRVEPGGLNHSAADNGDKPERIEQILHGFFDKTAPPDHRGGRR